MKKNIFIILACAVAFIGCSDSQPRESTGGHKHDQPSPHGGTIVPIGKHKYALELVQDSEAGKMHGFILEAHMKFVPVPENSFEIVVQRNGQEKRLRFDRVGAPGSAGLPEKSSQFEASADWLKGALQFEAVIPEITLNGTTFTNIEFAFPVNNKGRL